MVGEIRTHRAWFNWENLTGAKRREWMGMGVAGMIIDSDYGSFPKIPYV